MSVTPSHSTEVAYPDLEKALSSIPWATDDDAQMRMVAEILRAESVRDALTPPEEGIGLRKRWIGKTFTINSATWIPSTIDTQPGGRYAFCECQDNEGHPFNGTIGGLNVMVQLARVAELGGFPVKVKLIEVQSRSNPDRKPLWLVMDGTQPGADF